jgi:hypothetical protein
MRIFGIAVTPPLYYIMNNMTIAQVELMASDVAVVNTKMQKDKKEKFQSPKRKALEDAARRWKEKYSNKTNEGIEFDGTKWKPVGL